MKERGTWKELEEEIVLTTFLPSSSSVRLHASLAVTLASRRRSLGQNNGRCMVSLHFLYVSLRGWEAPLGGGEIHIQVHKTLLPWIGTGSGTTITHVHGAVPMFVPIEHLHIRHFL